MANYLNNAASAPLSAASLRYIICLTLVGQDAKGTGRAGQLWQKVLAKKIGEQPWGAVRRGTAPCVHARACACTRAHATCVHMLRASCAHAHVHTHAHTSLCASAPRSATRSASAPRSAARSASAPRSVARRKSEWRSHSRRGAARLPGEPFILF